jgi:hypothetical protein
MQQFTWGKEGSDMLSMLSRRRTRIGRIDAEAEALIHDFGDEAYSQALRREREASSDEIAKDWAQLRWRSGTRWESASISIPQHGSR